jgi:ankyrin repeat protein
MQLLLDHGANPLLQDLDGHSALYACCGNADVNICKLLYKYGATNELLSFADGTVYILVSFNLI